MKRTYLSFYAIMVLINLLTFIPINLKGILGVTFILITAAKFNYRDGYITATLLIILRFLDLYQGRYGDYQHGVLSVLLGSITYYFIAYFLGKSIESLRKKNNYLKMEIERRKDTEKELKEKLAIIQSLMDTIPNAVCLRDLNNRFTRCNHAYEDAIGMREEELIGKTIYEVFDRQWADECHKRDMELLYGEDKGIYETKSKYADGSLRDVIINKALFKNETGKAIGIVSVTTDITDKKVNEMLHQSVVQNKNMIDVLLEHDKMKTEFFSNISHELRTPLNVILSSLQLMETYSKNNQYHNSQESVIRNITIMKKNSYRLLRLVNNIIDITKIDASAFEINLYNWDIVNVVEEITLSVSKFMKDKEISLVFDTDIEEKIIACDDEKIERIILNLLSNAVKFTPKGGNIFVNIHEDDDGGVLIKVRDNGIGIPINKQDEIFERFCHINDLFSRENEGSGIGLSLVKNLVELHGGSITVESELGKGTIFTIRLPFKMVEERTSKPRAFAKQDQAERIYVEFSDIDFAS